MEWEQCKENVKPKREGRTVSNIATPKKDNAAIAEIQERQAEFEKEIENYEGDDELDVWDRYVRFMDNAYPEGDGQSEVSAIQLRLARKFMNEERYKNDVRLLNAFIDFATQEPDATQVYGFCYKNKIGLKVPRFWNNFASAFIYKRMYKKAMSCVTKARKIFGPEYKPFKVLELEIAKLMHEEEESAPVVENLRSVGSTLKCRTEPRQDVRQSAPRQPLGNQSEGAKFRVLSDNEAYTAPVPSNSCNPMDRKRTDKENTRSKPQVLEKELLSRGLLADYTPLIRHICLSPNLYPSPRIQSVAVLALAKLMMVSSEFCDENINLLFTILDKSECEKTRCNIMVTLHDLVMRFPNLLVNWTPNIYARLRDQSVMVRKTTIRVLTNLILNDMVKVKGQISELAVCLEDKEAHIRSLTQLFFTELGKKANAIYNVLPDIISHLSDPDTGRSSEEFQSIMKYLFEFVEKDKQAESLVEKLCHRFRATRTDRQWHDLSFCLTLIQYSEKSLKQLSDNLVCYHDKLADNAVYENFNVIIEKCRKAIKFDHKELIDDFEVKVKVCHGRGGEGEEAPTEEMLLQMKNLLTKNPAPKATRTRKAKVEKDDQDDKENMRSQRTTRKKVRAKLPSTSDDEDDLKLPEIAEDSDSDLDVFVPKSKKKGRKARGRA